MERYHIFRLGLAITFYAAYCIRPMLVYSLEADSNLDNNKNILNSDHEYFQYFQGVDGRPGRDYPIYSYIPKTTFNCRGIESGYYADLETDCQVFHICEEGKKISFLCPNGTIFQQSELICEWWNKVNCTNSPNLYEESAEKLQNEVARRKSSRRVAPLNGAEMNHGAVMRTEERASVRATKNGKEYPLRQQTDRGRRVQNHRIPDNNDIEQHIEESNNRHLANAHNLIPTSAKNSGANEIHQQSNQDYNAINYLNHSSSDANESSYNKQTKKDIDKETGNFFNQYDEAGGRHSKKIAQNEKNNYNFGTKTPQQRTTLKEYHVEFPSTSPGIDSASARSHTSITSGSYNAPQITSNYGTRVSNINVFSSTTPIPQNNNIPREFGGSQDQKETPAVKNTKVNRGNVKFNSKPNHFEDERSKDDNSKHQVKLIPVTTYSPPVKYSTAQRAQNSRTDSEPGLSQGAYDLPFPKHKSELTQNRDQPEENLGLDSSTLSSRLSVTPAADSRSSRLGNAHGIEQDRKDKNQESDETQVPQESSSFVKSSFNAITDGSFKKSSSPYPNHRSTYSDIKDLSYLEAPKVQSISSITAHLVTTQPINNGRPFVGSRVGTTLLPNQPTTQSKYTYLPTTSTDTSKPTIVFGVIRHSSTTEPSPYGPPELLGTTTEHPVSEYSHNNIGNTETTTEVTKSIPTESFNVGSTVKQDFPASTPKYGSFNVGSEPASNNFVNFGTTGAAIETSTVDSREDFNFDVSSTLQPRTGYPPISDRFNVGSTDKTLPTLETTTVVTNALPTELFNVGSTDTTLKSNTLPDLDRTTLQSLAIYVPEQGSLNLGQNEVNVNDGYNGLEPVSEPPFIKKSASLLYSNRNGSSTVRTVDHATVYGTYASTTLKPSASSRNTPYSPTVPTVTQSSVQSHSTIYGSSSSPRAAKGLGQGGVPIRFADGQNKISVQLSRNLGGQTHNGEPPIATNSLQPPLRKVNAVVRVADAEDFGEGSSTTEPLVQSNGFYVTKDFNGNAANGFSTSSRPKTERPRPFSRTLATADQFKTGVSGGSAASTAFPAYQISSARPFGVSQTTRSTPFVTTPPPPTFSVYDNIDSMMNVLQEIANYNNLESDNSGDPRPGLVIPPSVGPQTLHSLAQYFANELQNTDPDKEALQPDTKEKLTSLLTAMTVHGYNNLFNAGSPQTPTVETPSETEGIAPTSATATRVGNEDTDSVSKDPGSGKTDDSSAGDDDLLTTTSLPELRQLARNFSLALSSYLHDPENFKKSLESLRPTEPPPLDGTDNIESSTTEDELLNFSDADVKPSTPVIPTATWGYIIASDSKNAISDEVKNSLNPDLHTADSQSFIPRYNNLHVDEKKQKTVTELPANHWTSSPQATKLWQKALSVNPVVVNEHFETTPSGIVVEEEGQEITEPELFNEEEGRPTLGDHSEISYDLRELPPISLDSTQVHGILIDFMNHTKSDEHNRLNRILKKLNTSEEEFLNRMKEIESNPLTKRLVLLLISECGANVTQDLGFSQNARAPRNQGEEPLAALESSSAGLTAGNPGIGNQANHFLSALLHPKLSEEDQDARALQLLNSLYTIASRFGKKR